MRFKTSMALAAMVMSIFVVQPAFAQRGPVTFTELRAAITDNIDPGKQRSYLTRVEHAEVQLPPNPCVSLHSLRALGNHVDAQAGKKFLSVDGARAIQAEIARSSAVYLPPNPCAS